MAKCDDAGRIYTVKPGTPIKYFIIGGIEEEIRFEKSKQEVISSTIKRIIDEESLKEIIDQLKDVSPILVTGSSGYLGSAVVQTLREHNVAAIGIDLIDSPTTNFIGCVSDINIVRKASSQGCKSIIHTAALHAPNLDFYSAHDYEKVNVEGTRNILSCAREFQMKAVVFSSTTSLMITKEVKEQEKDKDRGPVILQESVDYGTPRNIYGLTKKAAEKICLEDGHTDIAILRCSRFFVEDVYDTGADPASRSIQKTNGNVKANEMLCGTRASLEDMIISHLVALERLTRNETKLEGNRVIGPLIISSISPFLNTSFDISIASNSQPYQKLGWSLPDRITRIYDSRNTWKILDYTPKWDFMRLVKYYDNGDNLMNIQEGRY